jgi:chromate reductase
MRIISFSGSLRLGSSNTALLLAAKSIAPKSIEIEIYNSLSDLPYYNPDLDRDPLPAAVKRMRDAVLHSDALLISTPEYAHGIPGMLKNALDWLVSDTQFAGKRVGLIYGSATDASFAKESLIEILTTMSASVIPDAIVNVAGVRTKVTAEGVILDPATKNEILRGIQALVEANKNS